jgi:hypothetical protein
VHQLFIDFKKACDSIKREVLYNILLEFGVPKKLVRLIKMCLNETWLSCGLTSASPRWRIREQPVDIQVSGEISRNLN